MGTVYQCRSNSYSSLNKIAARYKKRKKNFKCLLLLDQWMDFEIISLGCSLGDSLPKSPAGALNSNILC